MLKRLLPDSWFSLLLSVCVLLLTINSAPAQTSAFTYQGKLADNGNPATGNYDFEFKLFDTVAVGTGTQQGNTVTVPNVTVTNGIFTVSLDFGACPSCFNGAARFLEIAVRANGGGSFTALSPRQPLTSTPYAIKSLTAQSAATADGLSIACVNCITSSQIQSVNGSAVTGTIPVGSIPTGSANYIQNDTTQQAATNFNISGNGTAGGTLSASILNATTQYRINGLRVFTVNSAYNDGVTIFTASNTFAGDGAGLNTLPDPSPSGVLGKFNAVFGAGAGQANITGFENAFFGTQAGFSNTTGDGNSFFGNKAGKANTTGHRNTFLGDFAGQANTSGFFNAFFGNAAGASNTTAGGNTFIGADADFNTSNPTGNNNTLLGFLSRVTSGISNGTAIGAGASVTQSNSLVLGSNANVGIGTTAPAKLLHLSGVGSNGLGIGDLLITGTGSIGAAMTLESTGASGRKYSWISTANSADAGGGKLAAFDLTVGAYRLVIDGFGNVGIGATSPLDKLQVAGDLRVGTGTNGCVKDANGTVIAGSCSSDVRFKRDIVPFAHLLDKVAQLQPVHFHWRADEFKERHFGTKPSYGLIAQEVEEVMPELVTEDEQGYKAVNYSKLPLLILQAVKELKAENDRLKKENEALRQQQQSLEMRVQALTQLVCKTASNADICKP